MPKPVQRKTVMIYDQQTEPLSFFVVDGDYRKFDGVYINTYQDCDTAKGRKADQLQTELSDFLYDQDGKKKLAAMNKFPTQEVVDGADVIVIGFLP